MRKDWTSVFQWKVVDKNGNIKYNNAPRRNVRTTAADWRSCLDWQSKIMGGDTLVGAAATGTATTAATATTVTLDSASAPGSTSAFNGKVITMGAAVGVIVSNTNVSSPVCTIDGWHDPTSWGATVTTPSAGRWIILPGNAPAPFLALTANATTSAASDTSLTSEITSGGLTRKIATYSHTSGGTSYQLQAVFNATSTFTVNKGAVFNALTSTAGGAMPFESDEPNPPTLVSGDQLTQTVTVNI